MSDAGERGAERGGQNFLPDGPDGDLQTWGQVLGHKLTVAALVVVSQVLPLQAGLCNNSSHPINMLLAPPACRAQNPVRPTVIGN